MVQGLQLIKISNSFSVLVPKHPFGNLNSGPSSAWGLFEIPQNLLSFAKQELGKQGGSQAGAENEDSNICFVVSLKDMKGS
jgi:hypothetical protein